MDVKKLLIATTNKKQREAILEMMTNYFINDTSDEDAIIEQAVLILHEDFGKSWSKAEKKAKHLVNELWLEAQFDAEAINEETREFYAARDSALADARGGSW